MSVKNFIGANLVQNLKNTGLLKYNDVAKMGVRYRANMNKIFINTSIWFHLKVSANTKTKATCFAWWVT